MCQLKIVHAGAGIPELLVGRASMGRLLLRRTDVGPATRIFFAGFDAPPRRSVRTWWAQNRMDRSQRTSPGDLHGRFVIAIPATGYSGPSLGSGAIRSRLQHQVRFTTAGPTFAAFSSASSGGSRRSVCTDGPGKRVRSLALCDVKHTASSMGHGIILAGWTTRWVWLFSCSRSAGFQCR